VNDLWYKNAIFYALDVRTFHDANGDGWGDFRGATHKLDYIADLGITCIWLLPFFPSPQRDNGYDVARYLGVDQRLGTTEDFEYFLHSAGERGLRVFLDLIVNHTSDQHPWFQAARRDPKSRYRNYYVWTDHPTPTSAEQKPIFPGEEAGVWSYDERAGAYYFHRFYHFQPELRIANSEVRDEITRIVDFWLSFPISGFRIDAASHMIEDKGLPGTAPERPHSILKELNDFVAARRPGSVLIGEADVPLAQIADFFGNGDQLNLIFNFLLSNDLFLALATERAEPIVRCLEELPAVPQSAEWLNFLRNLDELDLERLTSDEREMVYQAFAPDEGMRIFSRGIRRRLAPMLQGELPRIKLAFSLLFSMPGAPLLVYGDELGMGDDLALDGRNAVRTPMQWTGAENAGFSSADAAQLVRPVIADGPFAYHRLNVEAQQADDESQLNWMKQLVNARRHCEEIGWGDCHVLQPDHPAIVAHLCDWKGSRLLAIHNLSRKACTATIDLGGRINVVPSLVFGDAGHEIRDGRHIFQLDPFGYAWFRGTAEA
jgi:maltose alpha-D-glucosyltransferase / alpha-amylase